MFESVLIANRGEIAVRIAKTLRKMGIRSVVVASIPDRRSLAVRTADAWVLLEGYSAAESYLDVDAVIAAAKAEGCQAIHPGYGFLSERADFAERCAAEGITFIGPPPAVLRGMGDKAAARQLAIANDVPVVPGWDGDDDPETLVGEAASIGYPVMLKARGGGGGRGMREVFAAEDLPEAIESARREAIAAFGDGGLLLEKLVTNAHHVEVQVLADTQGNVIHLGERDCSVQRRHQKLIEESPSPVVDDALRERLTGYALKLARAINYVNAGTFEFLVSAPTETSSLPPSLARKRGRGGEGPDVYFLEVNPRLQVEHPVTEVVTGLDLVELQLRIAAGEPLPLKQEDVQFSGHAIEFRINAEDPWDGFKPSSGRIDALSTGPVARADFGFAAGDTVPANYDSLLGKLIVDGRDRAAALERIEEAAHHVELHGPTTNLELLRRAVLHPDFAMGAATVEWLEVCQEELLAAAPPLEHWAAAAASVAMLENTWWEFRPWKAAVWIGPGPTTIWLSDGQAVKRATVSRGRDGLLVAIADEETELRILEGNNQGFPAEITWRTNSESRPLVSVGKGDVGEGRPFLVRDEYGHESYQASAIYVVPPPPLPRRVHTAAEGATAITAPLAGTIAAVRVAEGDEVAEGQLLLVLEAMKMEHRITAPSAGVVKAVHVRERDVVREGDTLLELA
ncbi:MAG: biotin/lipoyl-binding protein [Dehalococcoidia bacterium]|nr:biotin/lipoyl-binding protein [Dehalococcoidia bacterium]